MSRIFAGAAMLAMLLSAAPGQAAYVVNVQQIGTRVYAIGAGTLNTTGLSRFGSLNADALVVPEDGFLVLGPNRQPDVNVSGGLSGPDAFGDGLRRDADASTGNRVGVANGLSLISPGDYVSGSDLGVSSATWNDSSLASLGLTAGTYDFAVNSGANADTLTVKIQAPTTADYLITIQQIGTRVYAIGAGMLNTTGLSRFGSLNADALVVSEDGFLVLGPNRQPDVNVSGGLSGPDAFGDGLRRDADASTGNRVGVANGLSLISPGDYVSGSDLGVSSATWNDSSLASLGLTAGTYDFQVNSGINAGLLRIVIGEPAVVPPDGSAVPEPASWVLMILGFGLVGAAARGGPRLSRPAPAAATRRIRGMALAARRS